MTATVLDTNTIMALWFFNDPALTTLRDWIAAGHTRLLTRDDALEELRRVLAYRQFACPPERQAEILARYRTQAVCVPAADTPAELPRCRDADDQKFLEIAHDGEARWLLTRDKALLRSGRHRLMRDRCRVITPEAWQKAFADSV
ncbi:putative toxin-antitoxin system toxin component, PIN family [Denitromonas halophila]|uniref:Putative toxin-antitoxin system toxin component, PIN family n=1 Tax=Denitromonas halophila TaxID=1629404 RepID=A0A557QY77_9RHOO|nr:putative toxin-antitoxin system toxin component, PIN family [Denitromonas halophila]TVO57870.1 putative toxin-antitoxin system toxin component, PIN family [Denitromonas halophila]